MDRKKLLRSPLVWIAVFGILLFGYSFLSDDTRGYAPQPTSVALQQLKSGNVAKAVIDDKEQRVRLTLNSPVDNASQIYTQYPAQATDEIFAAVQEANPKDGYDTQVSSDSSLFSWLIYLLPIVLIIGFLMWMMNNSQAGGNKVMGFGKSKAKLLTKDMPSTKFTDVAGADEAVEELNEIKDFLANPARYQALGAKIPKGVLLYGPPGTGKTLLARAVAGEAGVPFYTISGSDFVEMFVGVGASRVRDLFEQAKSNAPAIIFVDEIDAVGRHRGAGMGGGHDEREQTLNQLLVEMDGFESKGGIILIAATNRPDILDPALLRPGRFDRQIPVSAPDLKGRQAVLAVHSKGKPFAPDVDFVGLSKRTVGMSGADLANVINEAALLTARVNGTVITNGALEESVDRVTSGPARKGKVISEKERKITAYHEGGHTLAAWAMEDLEPVYKVTIMPRGRTGGHALVVPEDDKGLMTRSEMIARLVMAMGGRAAEELVFAEPTTGASSDIAMATKVARAMVTEYGMSAKLGAVKYGTGDDEPFLGRTYGTTPGYSHETAGEIDDEIRALIEAAHTEAWAVLNENRDILDALAMELLEKETLDRADLTRIFADVVKRPKITSFDEFGTRVPSDRPPIKTPRELAAERGEEWNPPVRDFIRQAQNGQNGQNGAWSEPGQQPNQGGYLLPPGGEPVPVPQNANSTNGHQAAPYAPPPTPYGAQPYGPPTNGHPHAGTPAATPGWGAPAGPYQVPGPYPGPPSWTGGVVSGPLGPLPNRGTPAGQSGENGDGHPSNGYRGNGAPSGAGNGNGGFNGPGASGHTPAPTGRIEPIDGSGGSDDDPWAPAAARTAALMSVDLRRSAAVDETDSDDSLNPHYDAGRAESAIRELLIAVGEDPDRQGLVNTPARVARAFAEQFAGLYSEPDQVLDTVFDENHAEMVLVRDIDFYSTCEHHLIPFFGKAHVGYIPGPDGRVTGLSKLARLVEGYARRPQVQERLTTQIADAMMARLHPAGVIVVMEAEHLCMAVRGVRKPGAITSTSAVRGVFESSQSTRAEAMSLIVRR